VYLLEFDVDKSVPNFFVFVFVHFCFCISLGGIVGLVNQIGPYRGYLKKVKRLITPLPIAFGKKQAHFIC
jgi:xanthine/uracil/vitamin C permease (AzgA family)